MYTGVECRRRVAVEELWPGGSCGRVSWFAPQNQGGGRRLNTPSRGGTGVGLGTDGGDGHRRRLGPQRGGGNLPARGVLAVFSKPATYPGFADPPQNREPDLHRLAASRRRLRLEERTTAVG